MQSTNVQSTNPNAFVCDVCGARVATLRRGRCWICYVRWADARPVGMGAACSICYDRRRDNLRMVEFQGSWLPMCHNCAGKTLQLSPVPTTVEGVRERLGRDRRWKERRSGRKDHRIFAIDRRQNDRRSARELESEWLDAEDLIIEIVDSEGTEEATRISRPAEREPLRSQG